MLAIAASGKSVDGSMADIEGRPVVAVAASEPGCLHPVAKTSVNRQIAPKRMACVMYAEN